MVRKILGNFGVRLISAIVNLMIAVVVSQYLGASGKGEQSLVLTMIAIVTIFDNMVGGASIVYLTNKLRIRELFVASYLWTLIVSVFSYIVLVLVELVPEKFILSVVILSTVSSIVSIHSSVLLGKENLKSFNLLSFLVPLISLFALLLQFALNWNRTAEAYVYALYAAYGITLLVSILLIMGHVKKGHCFSIFQYMENF